MKRGSGSSSDGFECLSNKVGVDLDGKNMFRLVKSYFNMLHRYGLEPEVYETERGYHLIVRGVKSDLYDRLALGDDPVRVELSEIRARVSGYVDDVLFDWKFKNGRWYKREKLDDDWLFRLPFWNMPVRKPKSIYRRVRNGR